MGFPKFITLSFLTLFTFLSQPTIGQIVFRESPGYQIESNDSTFFGINDKRSIISLNGEWQVHSAGDKEQNKVSINVPSIFQGTGELVFEKSFVLSSNQINNHRMTINFLGLNYTADISVNNIIIYRHSGGDFPFKVELPKDVLKAGQKNILSIKLHYSLDSENTIPVKQRFLFPQNFGGIFRDVYLYLTPNVSISSFNVSDTYESGSNRAKITVKSKIENKYFRKAGDSTDAPTNFTFKVKIVSPDGRVVDISNDASFTLKQNKEKNISQNLEISSPELWSPENPQSYKVELELWSGTDLLDNISKSLAIYSLTPGKNQLTLNGQPFNLNGVTYIPSFEDRGSMASYSKMEADIKMIKNLGFNTVRFSKDAPHPYYLQLCEKYGLLAFIELPINGIPNNLAEDQNFITRSRNYLTNFLLAYKNYSAVAAIGLGSSYLPQFGSHRALIRNLADLTKQNSNFLTYASFSNSNVPEIHDLDLYGIELFNKSLKDQGPEFHELQDNLGRGKVFISSATYVVYAGNTNGYVNEHSFEAQAKYFDDLIDYSATDSLSGYFINSMFDYRGDFASLVAGYSKENLYRLGIVGEERSTSRLSYKVIYSKLHNTEKVTIPIGSKSDDAPMIFIIFGLVLALIIGILVNSGRKFREDASRALLRPYNFYADVRDQRIMSGFHSTILALVIAAVSALLIANLLFFLRTNLIFEKFLLAFGNYGLMKTASYLSWHPLQSLGWLTISFMILLALFTAIIKSASFFVRNRVFSTSVYFTVIWSFLPLILLIPVGIILYRLLNAEVANLYIYASLLIFGLWIFYRLMKGIYVIFDVNASSVYFYSILIVIVVVGGILLYYQALNSTIDYLQMTIKQYHIFG